MKCDSILFWETVLSEYAASEAERMGICLRSDTFDKEWRTNKSEMINLGSNFLNETGNYKHYKLDSNCSFLFLHKKNDYPYSYKDRINGIRLRLDFIKWNINRLKNFENDQDICFTQSR